MKSKLMIALLCLPFLSRADHGAGVDLFYTHIADSTYSVNMVIYGNCTDRVDYVKLFTLNPQIDVFDNTVRKFTLSLNLIADSTRDASPYCRRQLDSTSCINPSSLIQGFTRLYYTDTITLPYKSAKWIFRFNTALKTGCSNRLGRPGALSNYQIPSAGNNITLDATLNNTIGNNSSPASFFSNIPLYCINVPSVFSQQTTDRDNDSLVYEVIPPKNSTNCLTISNLVLRPGYAPLHTVAGTYAFSSATGRMTFTPDISQISAVAMRISEYRNGVLIGTVERERIFKVLGTCNNLPPLSPIDTANGALAGATLIGHDSLITCPGNVVRFSIPVSNPYGDTVRANVENILAGSNVVIRGNNTTAPRIDFSWNTVGVANGVYTFSVRYVTSSCPLPSTSLADYTIIIGGAGDITATQMDATHCLYKAGVRLELANGRPPYELTISQGGNIIKTYTSTSGVITDSLSAGTYQARLTSAGLPCISEAAFEVVDSGAYPFAPVALSPVTYCRNADVTALVARGDSLATLRWYDPAGAPATGTPLPASDKAGTFIWTVSQRYKSCESAADTVRVTVSQDECNYDPDVHNVITPNGDGKNDKWIIERLHYYPNAVVQLYNKLGDKVLERTNYQNDWDGDSLPSGVYYYLIRLNGVNRTSGTDLYKGYLIIKR